jgi:formylglycine-generating enzyme required for sulfatase activity
MQTYFDVLTRFDPQAITWAEYTSIALFLLTALLLALTYGLKRPDWSEFAAWLSLATVVSAIHFMIVGWREIAAPDRLDMPVVAAKAPEAAGIRFHDCPMCPEMVVVPSGLFVMGADTSAGGRTEEEPARKIMIANRYALSRRPVSAAEFAAFAQATGHRSLPCAPNGPAGAVQCISWQDAAAYGDWLLQQTGRPYRLPSQAQWEHAARAGAGRPSGPTEATLIQASLATTDVTSGNAFGIAGLEPTRPEFVADCWSPTLSSLPADGQPLVSGSGASSCMIRVLKGGALPPSGLAARRPVDRSVPVPAAGFRVARELAPLSPR